MNLNHVAVFLAVAEARSFTGAARKLRADKAHVSRVVRALEQELDVVLVRRTTRAVTLTPAGEQLFARAAGPLAALQAAAGTLVDRAPVPTGEVTLTTTPDLGRALVAPVIAAFRARFPAVRVKLHLEAALVDLADAGIDLALRVGPTRAGAYRTRRLGEVGAGFFASPRYLFARGTPRQPGDLALHDGLWPPAQKRKSFAVKAPPPPPAIECDDFGALLELARAGAGVAVLPLFLAAEDVARGSLVRVVPELELPGAPLYLLTTAERPLPPRVAALRDVLIDRIPRALSGLAPPRA